MVLGSPRSKLLAPAFGIVMLVAHAGCSEAHRDRPGRTEKPAAVPAPPPAPTSPSAPASTPAAEAAIPVPPSVAPALTPLVPENAKGTSLLQIWLAGQRRLGGFALGLSWDAQGFVLGQPQTAAALEGYICQPNLAVPGQLRFNCVGLPGEDRGGLLASIPVSWKDRPPVVADFRLVQNEVVDDRGAVIAQAQLELQVAAPAP